MTLASNRIFIVHGHDELPKDAVTSLIAEHRLVPVVIHHRPTVDRPVIDTFSDHADPDVAFVVVLLTGDDVGYARSADPTASRLRPTQTAVLELGYYVARLGHARVCALFQPGVELPTDYIGVSFVEMDPHGDWQAVLLHRMETAGVRLPARTDARPLHATH